MGKSSFEREMDEISTLDFTEGEGPPLYRRMQYDRITSMSKLEMRLGQKELKGRKEICKERVGLNG